MNLKHWLILLPPPLNRKAKRKNHTMTEQKILCGNSLELLKTFPDNHFDAVVTDPPYGLSFMNKHWDYDVPTVELWREVLRVLKFGGHILVACGTRTQHRMAVNIEDAGFEIRDVITWHYGSGFPKSLDVSKAIDKAAGAEREDREDNPITAPTDEAKEWDGWGTALKPSTEFWTLARKPLSENTIAENVLKYGTGGINIDGCRVKTSDGGDRGRPPHTPNKIFGNGEGTNLTESEHNNLGRFPANLILAITAIMGASYKTTQKTND